MAAFSEGSHSILKMAWVLSAKTLGGSLSEGMETLGYHTANSIRSMVFLPLNLAPERVGVPEEGQKPNVLVCRQAQAGCVC